MLAAALILTLTTAAALAQYGPASEPAPARGNLPAYHPPVFQRGNQLSQPLPLNDPRILEFLIFYSQRTAQPLPTNLTSKSIVHFPSQRYDNAGPLLTNNLPKAHPYTTFTTNSQTSFTTSSACVECHDGVQRVANQKPYMTVWGKDDVTGADLLANWSEYGEWSVSLMGLSARDPVFTAQVESERDLHSGIPGSVIDNVCYSCHGAMGEKQQLADTGKNFSHNTIYATPDNFDPTEYPFNTPGANKEHARYGALARDGVSCNICHRVGPGDNQWNKPNGEVDWSIFYGPEMPSLPAKQNPPGPPYLFTSHFEYNLKKLYVPGDGLERTEEPMLLHGIARSEQTRHLQQSQLCGTCHVVIVPKVPKGYQLPKGANPYETLDVAYEQTTYFEYLNSNYPQRQIECQTCHMPGVRPPRDIVANISPAWYSPNVQYSPEHKLPPRTYARHRLLGINLFVHEMFQQFYDVLGLADPKHDNNLPPQTAANLLNAEQSIVQHATAGPFGATADINIVRVTDSDDTLTATVHVRNNAGHKFPTGAGFRRAFIEFNVLDANGEILWASGKPNKFGAIVDGKTGVVLESEFTTDPDKIEPHYNTITNQSQAIIYEVRTTNELGVLTTSTLSLFGDVKDNRLLPRGWLPPENRNPTNQIRGLSIRTMASITEPDGKVPGSELDNDPYYTKPLFTVEGADRVTFVVDKSEMSGTAASVKAIMHYQTIPPYFLVDRFNTGHRPGKQGFGSATQRLIYLASRLETNLKKLKSDNAFGPKFNIIENWTMNLSQDQEPIN